MEIGKDKSVNLTVISAIKKGTYTEINPIPKIAISILPSLLNSISLKSTLKTVLSKYKSFSSFSIHFSNFKAILLLLFDTLKKLDLYK